MSDLFPLFEGNDSDGDRGDDGGNRGDGRRSAWTVLTVLAFAVTVVVLATLMLRSNTGSHHSDNQLAGPSGLTSPSPTSTAATQVVGPSDLPRTPTLTSRTSPHPSKSPTATASKSTSKTASPSRTPTPSHGSSTHVTPTPTPTPSTSSSASCPCSLHGDGGAVAALNAYRSSLPKNVPQVPGSVTTSAQSCAESLALGTKAFCRTSAIYAVESSQDGTQAVADAVSQVDSTGTNWFGEKSLRSFEVGWAYDGAGRYYCVFLEN